MATDKRLDQVKLVNSAESVLVVNGDQVEKAALAGFANSMGSSVPLQQNAEQVGITGLYARTSDGKMVELTSDSVAKVMEKYLAYYRRPIIESGDLNSFTSDGSYIFAATLESCTNTPAVASMEGLLMVFKNFSGVLTQIYSGIHDCSLHIRTCYGDLWNPWRRVDNFGYNTLAELSSGVAGQMNNVEYEVSSDDAVVIAQEVVSKVTSLMFNVIANGSTRSLVSGYVYPNKLYGLITVSNYDGSVTIVTLNNGSFTKS